MPQIESCQPDTSNPAITFPPTGSYAVVNSCTSISSVNAVVCEEVVNETSAMAAKTSVSSKAKNKLPTLRFWQTKKSTKKGDSYPSSASVSSSSNATSGFHSQSGNALESIDIENVASAEGTSV